MDRGGLTKIGRSLDKHGNRPGTPFPKAIGNQASKNRQGQQQLQDILTHPHGKIVRKDAGDVQIHLPDGRGVYVHADGSFRGFLNYE